MRHLISGIDWAMAGAASVAVAAVATPAYLMNLRRSIRFSSLSGALIFVACFRAVSTPATQDYR
jgi:hypothetical protein